MARNGQSLKHLVGRRLDPESMADECTMDISATVYRRMKELGLRQRDLADRMGVKPARVSRILSGDHGINLVTMAKLEDALGIDITYGFREPRVDVDKDYQSLVMEYKEGMRLDKFSRASVQDLTVGAV